MVNISGMRYLLLLSLVIVPFSLLFSQEKLSTKKLDRGKNYFFSSKYEKAINALNSAIDSNSLTGKEKEEALLFLGLSYAKNNQIYLAEEELEEVLNLNPEIELNPEQFDNELIVLLEELKKEIITSFKISTNPDGAEVYINGKIKGETPLDIVKIVAKKYEILILKNGYQAHRQNVVLKPGEPGNLDVTLDKKTNRGHIVISSTPEDVDVFIDSTFAGKTPLTVNNVAYGNHIIGFVKKNYDPRTGTFHINEQQNTYLDISLEKRQNIFLLSALFPGLGQIKRKHYAHGFFFAGTTAGFFAYYINYTYKNDPNKGKLYMSERSDGFYIGENPVLESEYRYEEIARAREREDYLNRKTKIWIVGTILYIGNLIDTYFIDKSDTIKNKMKKLENFSFQIEPGMNSVLCNIKFQF